MMSICTIPDTQCLKLLSDDPKMKTPQRWFSDVALRTTGDAEPREITHWKYMEHPPLESGRIQERESAEALTPL